MKLFDVWNFLSQVKTLELHAASRQMPDKNWSGTARGQVNLSKTNQDIIIFDESGEWIFGEKPAVKFFNIYRWTRQTDSKKLELSHLRNGIDAPVHIVEFAEIDCFEWRSSEPHLCRDDIYEAFLSIEKDSLILKWTIIGPNKKQKIECIYK